VMFVSERQSTTSSIRIGRQLPSDELRPLGRQGLSRYDLLLGGIALALGGAWLVGHLTGVPEWAAMAVGSLLAAPLVADGLAVNPPQ